MKLQSEAQYWEILYEHLHRSGWSMGWVSYLGKKGDYWRMVKISKVSFDH